jgi:hypothetical protein
MNMSTALLMLLVLLFTAACGTALAATAAYALLAWTPLLRWLAP